MLGHVDGRAAGRRPPGGRPQTRGSAGACHSPPARRALGADVVDGGQHRVPRRRVRDGGHVQADGVAGGQEEEQGQHGPGHRRREAWASRVAEPRRPLNTPSRWDDTRRLSLSIDPPPPVGRPYRPSTSAAWLASKSLTTARTVSAARANTARVDAVGGVATACGSRRGPRRRGRRTGRRVGGRRRGRRRRSSCRTPSRCRGRTGPPAPGSPRAPRSTGGGGGSARRRPPTAARARPCRG